MNILPPTSDYLYGIVEISFTNTVKLSMNPQHYLDRIGHGQCLGQAPPRASVCPQSWCGLKIHNTATLDVTKACPHLDLAH